MRIAITGSTGLVGTATITALKQAGHDVVALIRPQSEHSKLDPATVATAAWDPASGELDVVALGAVDAVVHLAGENIASGRWTEARKRRIAESRGPATERLCRALAALPTPPRVLISASATGIYGDRDDEELHEESELGDPSSFLVDVAKQWEAATGCLSDCGARVVNLRIGIVIDKQGGALARMLLPFRLGIGGTLGNGMHWMSWIHLHDLVRAILHTLTDNSLRGPVLAVAPTPVTNRVFTKALGKVLGRPTVLPVPGFALRLLFGELASVLLGSQRARPHRLLESGFEFACANIESALRTEFDS